MSILSSVFGNTTFLIAVQLANAFFPIFTRLVFDKSAISRPVQFWNALSWILFNLELHCTIPSALQLLAKYDGNVTILFDSFIFESLSQP